MADGLSLFLKLTKLFEAWWPRAPVTLSLFCDGSSHGLRGRAGGWAFAVVRDGRCLHEGSGGERSTTSNQMELRAALEGLTEVVGRGWHEGARVELVSDSRITLQVAAGEYLPNNDRALAEAVRAKSLEAGTTVRWVRGHSGERWNEHVDALARAAREQRTPQRARKKAERRAKRP